MQQKEIGSDRSFREEDFIMEIAAFAYRKCVNRQFEEIANDPDACDFSPEAAERLHNKVMANFAKHSRKQARRKAARRFLRAAASFMVVLVLASFALFHVDAARVAAANCIIQTFPQYSDIRYDAQMNAQPPLGWVSPYYPTWLPVGTRVVRLQVEDSVNHYIWYANEDGYEFHFAVIPAVKLIDAYGYDTENMLQEEISINGYTAILSYEEERNIHTLVILTTDHMIMLRGQLPESEIIKAAERIHFP